MDSIDLLLLLERTMLELDQVTKSFGEHVVLHPTTLDLRESTTTVLIGPSGCGKSTLLRMMIGLIQPDAGTIRFRGELFTKENELSLRHQIGYVIQDGGLFPHLTAADNVSLLARHLGQDCQTIQRRTEELADLVRLPKDMLQRFPFQLSGGQRQRVGIMRALMLDPPLILLDEPMGALDPLVRYDLQNDLRDIFRTLNKTVVLVTHDMGEAGFFGDDVLLLGDGCVVQRGTLDDLIQSPANEFVSRFIRHLMGGPGCLSSGYRGGTATRGHTTVHVPIDPFCLWHPGRPKTVNLGHPDCVRRNQANRAIAYFAGLASSASIALITSGASG